MKVWERARIESHCGLCGQPIPVGALRLARWIVGHSWRKLRCTSCAGEVVPEHVPPLTPLPPTVPMTPIKPMHRLRACAVLPFDWKARQAERDAGEDG